MAGPLWLSGTFAALIIATAAYCVGRLVVSRLRGRVTELDADALHAVMGAAMAGMLAPQLNVLPSTVWAAVFGTGAAWFGWQPSAPGALPSRMVRGAGSRSPPDRVRRHALHAPAR
jgi:Domain of unknown function (DUF5134)